MGGGVWKSAARRPHSATNGEPGWVGSRPRRGRDVERVRVEMESTVTVKMRTIVLTTAIMVAMRTAYFVGSLGGGGGVASAGGEAASGTQNKIVMTGSSDVTGIPDQLTFQGSVRKTSSDV